MLRDLEKFLNDSNLERIRGFELKKLLMFIPAPPAKFWYGFVFSIPGLNNSEKEIAFSISVSKLVAFFEEKSFMTCSE